MREIGRHGVHGVARHRDASRRPALQPDGLEVRPVRSRPVGLVAHAHEQIAHSGPKDGVASLAYERVGARPNVGIDRRDRGLLVLPGSGEQHVELGLGHRAIMHAPLVGPGLDHQRAFAVVGDDLLRPPRDVDARAISWVPPVCRQGEDTRSAAYVIPDLGITPAQRKMRPPAGSCRRPRCPPARSRTDRRGSSFDAGHDGVRDAQPFRTPSCSYATD